MPNKLNFAIKVLISSAIITLFMLFTGKYANAEDAAISVNNTLTISNPISDITDTTTIAISSIQSKIDSATSSLQSNIQYDGNSIISVIQSNVPTADTETAIKIATTQSPISDAVETATAKIQEAQNAIETATVALNIANNDKVIFDSHVSVVADDQIKFDSSVSEVNDNTIKLQSAQNTLSSAPLVNVDVTSPGLIATVYHSGNGGSPSLNNLPTPTEVITIPQVSYSWGGGQILNSGYSDHVIVKIEGKIILPSDATVVKYAIYSDDGSKLYINNNLVINNWRDQGPTWSPYSQEFNLPAGSTQDITIWYYENGGGAVLTLGYMINNQYFTSPTAINFSHTTSSTSEPDPALAQAVLVAQQNLNDAQNNLNSNQQDLQLAKDNLAIAQQNLNISLQTANSLADTATIAVQEAITATSDAVQVTKDYYAQQAAIKAAQDKAIAEAAAAQARAEAIAAQQAAEAARVAAEKALADQQAAEAAKAKAEADALTAKQAADAKAAQDIADAKAKADQDAANAKAEADAKAAEQAAKDKAVADAKAIAEKLAQDTANKISEQAKADQAAKDAQAKADDSKAELDKAAQDTIGVKPNSPDQLSDTVVKQAPAEVLVPHIQQDVKGVENGGIQFFGTKSAPQVVGEDGKLTPPAPPPGSGLPIPADAITTTDTFIGQPGGTSFNAPDIAVPVVLTPVTGALAAVPGVEAINQAFVAMANIGNDMSPVTRKKAKKILVTTVVVGQIVALRRRFGN